MKKGKNRIKSKYNEGTLSILRESEKEKKKYFFKVLGKKFVVYPNVFSPKYFNDTEFFAKFLPIKKNEEFLEIGCGTGIVSIFAKKKGAKKVVAVDINPAAIKNAKENSKLTKTKIDVRKSNVYSKIKKNEKFDTIFWNTPFAYIKNKKLTYLERSVQDPGYKYKKIFINEAKKHLKPNGRLLIGFSSTLGQIGELRRILKKAGFSLKLVKMIKSKEKYPVNFEIFGARPKITTIIFDVGGVQYFYDHMRAARPISKEIGIDVNKVYNLIARGSSKPGMAKMAEYGSTEKEYWQRFAKDLNVKSVNYKRMSELWNKCFWPNKPMHSLIKRVKKKYKIGILSNMAQGHKKFLQKKGIEKPFKKKNVIWSCDVDIVKPNPKIYTLVLKRMNASPGESVFIDDNKKNIKAAKKLGINGIVYKNHKKFLKELKKLGVEW